MPTSVSTADRTAAILDDVRDAAHRGRTALLALQKPDGHWCGELEGDTILESEFVLLLAFLGEETDPRVRKLANYLREKQLPTGGWPNYPGGPAEVSVSVKAYFALKLAGDSPDAPHMQRAAEVIRSLGGAAAVNSFTRFYLALLGQIPYSNCPTVPAEMILLPDWFPFNVYKMSAWSRTIVVPLSVVSAFRPVRKLSESVGIRELFLDDPATPWKPANKPAMLSWANFFLKADAAIKLCERIGFTPLRRLALRKAVTWMRERFADSDGLGAIFPPMIYTVIVLRCLGVPDDAPEMCWARKQLDDLMLEDGDTLRLQPCLSPVWDTALATIALADASCSLPPCGGGLGWGVGTELMHEVAESGGALTPHPNPPPQGGREQEVSAAIDWLLSKEVSAPGDWCRRIRGVPPAGWFFEYRNAHYPDTDDTAMVLMALARSGRGSDRALRWLLALQNDDGGWAAFDRGITNEILTQVPFADHNAMLDPSCPDITARVMEALAHYGHKLGDPAIDRGLAFVLRRQEASGAWFGRWGVNYLYGTWQVLVGLAAVGFDMTSPPVRRAVRWLHDVQNSDGGWGESCASYDDPALAGQGPSTASQTAWALLGLLAARERNSPEVRAGIEYLLGTQNADGLWTEEPFTGTGFPKVFYLKYHLYPAYFPLMALGRYAAGFRIQEPGFRKT